MHRCHFRHRLFASVPLLLLLACGSGLSASSSLADPGRTLQGEYVWRPVPANEQVSTFRNFSLTFVAYEALAGGNALATLSTAQPLPTAAFSCATTGCTYQQKQVDLGPASKGAFALIAPVAGSAADVASPFLPTATMVISPNQLLVYKASRSGFSAMGQAAMLSQNGLAQLASLAQLSADALHARGVCIGTVATSRNGGTGALAGQAGAFVSLVDPPAGAQVFYISDDGLTLVRNGTNAAGTFVVVGPAAPPADGSATTIAVTVTAASSGLQWPDQAVILRPQLIVAMPILPYP